MIALRPRRPTELIDASLTLLRGRYLRLIALSAVLFAPYVAVSLALSLRFGTDADREWLVEMLVLYFACGALAHAALSLAIADLYHDRPLDTASALRRMRPHALTVVAAGLAATGLTFLGFLLIIVPGIVVMVVLFAIPVVTVLEGRGFTGSFRRTFQLARGYGGTILASYGLTWLVLTLLTMILQMLVGGPLLAERPVAVNLVESFLSIVTYPVYAAVTTLLYYDLRIRKEGYDIELLASRLSDGPAADAAAVPHHGV